MCRKHRVYPACLDSFATICCRHSRYTPAVSSWNPLGGYPPLDEEHAVPREERWQDVLKQQVIGGVTYLPGYTPGMEVPENPNPWGRAEDVDLLKLEFLTQRNANFDSNVPLPGLGGLLPRLEREDDEATMAASPKNPHDVSALTPVIDDSFSLNPLHP
eukprot:795584-Amphidinium_carterae.1